MNDKTDLRILKTKKNLYEALLQLLEEKPFEEIKVSEICSISLINRSTFYTHFEDKYSLLDSLIKDLKTNLQNELKENDRISNTKEYYLEVIHILLIHVEEKKNIYVPIVTNNRNSIAIDMIYDTLKEDIKMRLQKENRSNIPNEFILNFYLGAISYVGIEWLRNKCNYKKEDIIEYLKKLIPEDI